MTRRIRTRLRFWLFVLDATFVLRLPRRVRYWAVARCAAATDYDGLPAEPEGDRPW